MLFESRVGGVAVAMTFASIFHFEFGFLWVVFLMLFWMPFGTLFGSFGGALGDFLGSYVVILAAVGSLGGPLGVQGRPWLAAGRLGGDFRDFPGNSGSPFGINVVTFCMFSVFFSDAVF